jgi:chemotaxis protein MotB
MRISAFVLGGLLLALASCVSSKKYVDARLRISDLRQDSMQLARSLQNCQDSGLAMNQTIGDLNGKLNKLIEAAKSEIANQKNKINSSQQTIEEQQKKLAELQSILQQQKEITDKLHKTISDALMNFKSDELSVFEKNGKVYVSMQEKLLFKSGSAVVGNAGKEALATVAQVLNANPDIKIEVEGHTDSIPIRGHFEDNWALSLARAASVTRILANDYHVVPTRITASGHSQFDPVDTNSTEEGRAHNRRTDIILAPNLDELYQLINQQQNPAATGTSTTTP